VARVVQDKATGVDLTSDGRPANNSVFMSAAGDLCQCRVRFLISFWYRGHKRASIPAAAINTGRCRPGALGQVTVDKLWLNIDVCDG
jgi:hypothetical protein